VARYSFLLQNVQTGPGAHPDFCSVGTVVLSLSIKGLMLEVDRLLLYLAEVKNMWGHTSAPPYAVMVWTGTALPSLTGRCKFSLGDLI